uniref:Uncharacterized protein n=1 Tax=Vespula pensylvanica TaxID=30213 RepID=A0A834NSD6_VESPE|nr:hypothetical protein H0235_011544 [Vespula pensylvanica]
MHEGPFHLGDSNGYGDGDGSGGSGMLVCPNTAWTSVLSYQVPSGQGQESCTPNAERSAPRDSPRTTTWSRKDLVGCMQLQRATKDERLSLSFVLVTATGNGDPRGPIRLEADTNNVLEWKFTDSRVPAREIQNRVVKRSGSVRSGLGGILRVSSVGNPYLYRLLSERRSSFVGYVVLSVL